MEGQLVVGLVGFELQYCGFGTQDTALEQVDCGEDLIVCYWALHQIVVVLARLATISYEIEPCLVCSRKPTDFPV